MPLRVPQVDGVGEQGSEEIHNRWDTMPWVEAQLTDLGVGPPKEPEYPCPIIEPGSLSTLNNRDYTNTYESLLGWFGYLSEKLAYAKSMVLQCDNEMEYLEVMTKTEIYGAPGKRPPSEVIAVRVQSNTRYDELKNIGQKWRQLRDCLQGRLNTVEANLKAVSRHIEIRKLDQGGTRQGNNMPYRDRPRT